MISSINKVISSTGFPAAAFKATAEIIVDPKAS